MKLPFKASFISLIIFTLFFSCLDYEYESDDFKLSENEKKLIRQFASENGYPESIPIDSFVRYIYYEYPHESDIKDYILTFPKQESIPRTLVLTDILTTIGKGLRVYHEPAPWGGYISPAFIDSIEIRTDSVIVLPGLNLSFCNLNRIPPEIGKMRVNSLDLRDNYLKNLPLEIISIFDHLSVSNGKIAIAGNPISYEYWDSLPDTLRNWITKNY